MADPKLLEAMADIKAVLKKHDCAGLVILASESHLVFLYGITPSWSCAKIETQADGREAIRIRSKLADYPSKEDQKRCLEATTGMFLGFQDVLKSARNDMTDITLALGSHFEIEHTTAFEKWKE